MRLLLYYIVHTFVNSIKKLLKSWVAIVIAFIILFGVVGGLTGYLISSFINNAQEQSEEEKMTAEGITEDQDEEEPKTAEEWAIVYQNITLIILLIMVFILVMNIYPGKNSGTTLFSMADVNMLLTSPIKPQTILLYKTIMQMGLMLLSTFYVMFQLPNLILNLNVPVSYAFYLLGIWLLMSIFCKLSSILAYTLTAGKEWAKKIISRGILVIAFLLGIIVFGAMKSQGISALEAARYVFLSKPAMCVPMVGWITGITNAIFTDNLTAVLIYLSLTILGLLVMILIIWNVKVDFYEDCISKASSYFEKVEASKAGLQINRERKKKYKTNEIGKGFGASCLFVNQMYNRKRFAKLGIITNTGITYLLASVLISLFFMKIVEINSIAIVGVVMLVICYIRNYGNPIARETSTSFLYLIPESAFSKLAYSILGSSVVAALDMLPAVVVAGVMMKAGVVDLIFWFLLLVSFDFILSNTGLLVDLLLPTFVPDIIKSMFAMFFKMFGIIPLAVCLPLSMAFSAAIIVGAVINVAVGIIFLIISSQLLVIGRK